MSSQTDQNKIVDLQQRQAAQAQQQDRLGDLIKQCRGIAQKRLALFVGALFDGVDDSMFDLAEKSENNSMQSRYFDGMREVRKKRQLVERLFQENITRAFARFAQPAAANAATASPSGGLALIEEDDLEVSIAVSAMVGKAETRLGHQLHALEQRFSVLAGGMKVDADSNPLAPKQLCEAFKTTLSELEVDLQVKLLILKLYDKQVMGGLEYLYDEVNQLLVQAGVLPQLKHGGPVRAPGAPGPGRPGDPSTASGEGGGPGAGRGPLGSYANEAELQAELYHTVQSLMANRRAMPGFYSPYAAMSGPAFATNEVLNALSVLQNHAMTLIPTGAFGASVQTLPIQQIKEDLVGQLSQFGSDGKQRMAAADEDTIDLVGMLFEFILQDRNLPTQMQALLARMQIPYLKCALLDKELFQKKEHPARQLLDELAQAGLSWSEEADKDGRVLEKVRGVVEALLKDFDDDVQIFERLLAEFRDFSQSTRKRAEVAELRAAEAARGRERLQGARKSAAKEVLTRIEGKVLPEVIRHLLTRPWANVLVLTILRQGEGSHAWKSALRVADELVWAAQPKQSDGERNRLRALVPELEKALRQGLAMVAYHENDVRTLVADLNAFYALQLDPAKAASAIADAPHTAAAQADGSSALAPGSEESFVDEIAAQPEVEDASAVEVERIEDEHYEVAKGLKVGTWIEFRPAQGRAERAKLSWVSPISTKYLFVNRKGLKVADKTVWSLAAEFRAGRALLLEDVPLFDRALDAIVERLKSTVGQDGSDAPAAAPAN